MIRIQILLENTTCREDITCRHGLSLYVETPNHKLLFDVGPDDTFIKNAAALGVDISAVDTVVLSHGHADHGGGIDAFFQANRQAPLYLRPSALEPYYTVAGVKAPRYIGLPPIPPEHTGRLRFTAGEVRIDGELLLFSDVPNQGAPLFANQRLRRQEGEEYPQDDFRHEQHLLLTVEDRAVLLAGCAHCGIVSIMERCEGLLGRGPDAVVGGFHLFSHGSGQTEPEEHILAIGEQLRRWPTVYYTGHCTGPDAYTQLKKLLGSQILPVQSGGELKFC